jgi:glutaredoxin-related protein
MANPRSFTVKHNGMQISVTLPGNLKLRAFNPETQRWETFPQTVASSKLTGAKLFVREGVRTEALWRAF